MTSQLSPRPSQLEQNEPNLIRSSSSSTEGALELQQLSFSIAIEDRADEDDDFQLEPPQLSTPMETGDQTGRSIEIGRRALQTAGKLSRGRFGTVRGSDRPDEQSALGLNDTSMPLFGDSVWQLAPDAGEEDPGVRGKGPNLESIVIWKGWGAMLTQHSDKTEDVRRAMHKDYDSPEDYLRGMQQARELEGGLHSPFVLRIPELQPRRSFAKTTYPDEQQLGDPDGDSEHSLLDLRSNNINATKKSGGNSPKPTKKSGFPYPSFPAGITKRIASTFARSMGSKSTIIDEEALEAIGEAIDQYFEQLSNDLGVLAYHAGRKKIDESDVIAVMRR